MHVCVACVCVYACISRYTQTTHILLMSQIPAEAGGVCSWLIVLRLSWLLVMAVGPFSLGSSHFTVHSTGLKEDEGGKEWAQQPFLKHTEPQLCQAGKGADAWDLLIPTPTRPGQLSKDREDSAHTVWKGVYNAGADSAALIFRRPKKLQIDMVVMMVVVMVLIIVKKLIMAAMITVVIIVTVIMVTIKITIVVIDSDGDNGDSDDNDDSGGGSDGDNGDDDSGGGSMVTMVTITVVVVVAAMVIMVMKMTSMPSACDSLTNTVPCAPCPSNASRALYLPGTHSQPSAVTPVCLLLPQRTADTPAG